MSAENQDQDFEKLQRLLKLKRYELPPPRYFNDFSSKVTARIRAGDVGRLESFEDVVAQAPWLQRIWRAIEGKPAVSGLFASAVCGVLLAGVFLSDKAPHTLPGFAENDKAVEDPLPSLPLFAHNPLGLPVLGNSTNPSTVLPGNSMFGTMPSIQTMPVSGTLPLAPR